MRIRELKAVITFPSTAAAMAAEQQCLTQNLPGRLIPVPREITAGCGLSWAAPPEAAAQVMEALRRAGVETEACTELMI